MHLEFGILTYGWELLLLGICDGDARKCEGGRWFLRSKFSETLLTFALSVGISLAAMKLRLCITTIQEYFKYFCSRWWLVLFWRRQGMQDAAAHPWIYAEEPALPPVCQHTHTWNRALMPWSRGLCFDLDCLGGSLGSNSLSRLGGRSQEQWLQMERKVTANC